MSASIIPCELHDIHKSFGRTPVLRGVNLCLQAGEITGLIGVNGAGKTTLFRILGGLEEADRGTLMFGGEACGVTEAVRARVAFVAHAPQLYPKLTARENLELFARLRAASGNPTMPAVEALTLVGLASAIDRPAQALSRGMAQRVVLARAVAARPALMILDEPFTALDVEGRETASAVLAQVRAEGTSVLLSSHDLEGLADVADRVVHLRAGCLRGEVARTSGEAQDSFRRRVSGLRTEA